MGVATRDSDVEVQVVASVRRANGQVIRLGEVGTPEFERGHANYIFRQPRAWKLRHPIVTLKARRVRRKYR